MDENVEAEALGIIAAEALETSKTYELDTTILPPADAAALVLATLKGEGEAHRAPWGDWSEVILRWY